MSATEGGKPHAPTPLPDAVTGSAEADAPHATPGSAASSSAASEAEDGSDGRAGSEVKADSTETERARGGRPDSLTGSAEADAPHGTPSAASFSEASGPEARSHGRAQTEASATKTKPVAKRQRRDRPYYVKRSKATQWLLTLFLLALAGAYLLYPRRAAVYRPSPLTIIVQLAGAQTGGGSYSAAESRFQIFVRPKSANVFGMDFAFVYHGTRYAATSQPSASIKVLLPPGTVPVSCSHRTTDRQRCAYSTVGAGGYLSDVTAATTTGDNVWEATLSLTLRSPGLTWNANGLTVEAQLPIVTGGTLNGSLPHINVVPLNGDSAVSVTYFVPDAGRYDWTGGPPPIYVTSDTGATWVEPLQTLSAPIAISGIDNYSADLDSLRTFIAGTLLGVAGAALVGAVQEFTQRKEDMPPAEVAAPGQLNKQRL